MNQGMVIFLLLSIVDAEIIGRYAGYYGKGEWASTHCPTGPANATINVEFGAKLNVKDSIANYPNSKWNPECKAADGVAQWFTIGGEAGGLTVAVIEAVGKDAAKINKQEGYKSLSGGVYTGVMFDIEGTSGATDALIAAFKGTFKAMKDAGLEVGITTSHSIPYIDSVADGVALMQAFAQDENVSIISPQLYTSGVETEPEFIVKAGAEWETVYGNMHSGIQFVPSIVKSNQYDAVKKYFDNIKIPCQGYFQWQKLNTANQKDSLGKAGEFGVENFSNQSEIIGRYAGYYGKGDWASTHCPTGPANATINVEFGAELNVKDSIANYPNSKWNPECKAADGVAQWFTIGGEAGGLTVAVIEAVGKDAAKINKQEGYKSLSGGVYTGVMFDIE